MKFLLQLLITAVVTYVLAMLLGSHVQLNSFGTALVFALVLAFLNAIIKPLLVILTLPITIITLGLFLLIINVLIILLADHFVSGIKIDGFLWALIFGFLLTILSSILNSLLGDKS
ncbi:MAG: phage holin family protein [Ginsengibacter sp.]